MTRKIDHFQAIIADVFMNLFLPTENFVTFTKLLNLFFCLALPQKILERMYAKIEYFMGWKSNARDGFLNFRHVSGQDVLMTARKFIKRKTFTHS